MYSVGVWEEEGGGGKEGRTGWYEGSGEGALGGKGGRVSGHVSCWSELQHVLPAEASMNQSIY